MMMMIADSRQTFSEISSSYVLLNLKVSAETNSCLLLQIAEQYLIWFCQRLIRVSLWLLENGIFATLQVSMGVVVVERFSRNGLCFSLGESTPFTDLFSSISHGFCHWCHDSLSSQMLGAFARFISYHAPFPPHSLNPIMYHWSSITRSASWKMVGREHVDAMEKCYSAINAWNTLTGVVQMMLRYF